MKDFLVSIIVPVYNVEKYLEPCLLSIANQTYKNIEVLIVNDGSTDNSEKVALQFTTKDNRFKLYSKINAGLSTARNFGIDQAQGDFICFVDSDDTIKLTFVEKLLNKTVAFDADMTFCLTELFSEKENKIINHDYFNKTPLANALYEQSFNHLEIKNCIFNLQVTAWNKIYKTSFLKKVSARFPDGLYFEDNPFFFRCILNANRVSFVNEQLYVYRIDRPGSITSDKSLKFFDHFKIMKLVEEELKLSDTNWTLYKKRFVNYKYINLLYWFERINPDLKPKFYKSIKKELNKDYAIAKECIYIKEIKTQLKLIQNVNYWFFYLITHKLMIRKQKT